MGRKAAPNHLPRRNFRIPPPLSPARSVPVFNGNTFADIGRQIAAAIFAELPHARLREVTSAVAHYIAGVLDHESLERIVNELSATADYKSGDRVKTMRGSMHGTVLRVLPDGRVVWRADSGAELTGLPESLICENKPGHSNLNHES